jgi:hypothetical protein
MIPLASTQLMGVPVPVVWATPQPFDARDAWAPVAKALGLCGRPPSAATAKK